MRRILYLAMLPLLLMSGFLGGSARAADAEDQQQIAEKFLLAYLKQDYATVKQCVPALKSDYFGPYPFKGDVTITRVIVDRNQALLEYSGKGVDEQLPSKGGLLFYKRKDVWYVRQVLYYERIPRIFNIPPKSTTAADRKHEPKVKEIGTTFLKAWKGGNQQGMFKVWYNWIEGRGEATKGLTIGKPTFENNTTAWKDPLVRYEIKLSYKLGPVKLSMNVKGGLVLCKDGNTWKVRPNQLIFYF